MHFYEDLVAVSRSSKLVEGVKAKERVLNVQNKRRGIKARRGDGTFGELIPGEEAIIDPGYMVARGPIATVDIGTEVKILAKAMIKQIDRVINDLRNQVVQFRKGGGEATICVAVVGINFAEQYTSYEGDRAYPTTGRDGYLHPIQEARIAEQRLADATPSFDEFLIVRFKATNIPPFPFCWLDLANTQRDYAAILTRVSSRYQQRF